MEHTFLKQILIQLFSTKHILVVYYNMAYNHLILF